MTNGSETIAIEPDDVRDPASIVLTVLLVVHPRSPRFVIPLVASVTGTYPLQMSDYHSEQI